MAETIETPSSGAPTVPQTTPTQQTPPAAQPTEQAVPATEATKAEPSAPAPEADSGLGTETQKAEPEQAESKTPDTLGVPEKGYSTEGIKLPQGYELDKSVTDTLADTCKDLGLSQKVFGTVIERCSQSLAQAQQQKIAQMGEQMLQQAKADPDIGQGNWTQTLADGNRAFKRMPAGAQRIMSALGLTKNPDFIRGFRDLGRALSDDTIEVGGSGRTGGGMDLKKFYDHSNMN